MISKEDLDTWNNFKKKCVKTRGVKYSELTNNGKILLETVKKSLKNECNININNTVLNTTSKFTLEKDKSLGIDWNSDRKLIQGKYEIDYRVDLHGLTIDEAYNKVKLLFDRAELNNYRCLLIITGKGLHSRNQTIKQSIIEWFKEPYFSNKIIKYTDAQKIHGGSGAIYVLIKR